MTSPETWEKIKRIFKDASEMAPEKRIAFAREECGDDAGAWNAIERLIESMDEADGFIEESIFESASSYSGKKIGNYRIAREIGRGGMGVVLLANREGDFDQQVAIKVLKRGIDSDEIVRRFDQERNIQASLNHPNIAGMIDGGSTSDGLPYFVMEYIDGLPLSKYCEANRLSTGERVDLFRKVCSAVSFAHGRLIVHRDLKPSNILVTSSGVPKLLDFGIAKILGDQENATRMTQTSHRLLTPEYASPEQVLGSEITTSSDVYSLGVILYELLTGRSPYNFTTRSPEEIFRLICDAEPISPEKAAGSHVDADLQNIVLMALRKEPERRYASVEQLREDLRRYEADLPVVARAVTWKYRASKFAKRNRLAVTAGILIFISLIAGIAGTLWQAAIAGQERDRAVAEVKRSDALNKFMQNILVSPDPEQNGKDVKIVEVLESAVERANEEFAQQPELRADALYSIGRTYAALGQNKEAEPLLRAANELNLSTRGADNENTFRSTAKLAECLSELNRDAEAIELLQLTIPAGRKLFPSGNRDLSYALLTLGESYNRSGDPEKAKPILEESVNIIKLSEGETSPFVIEPLLALSRVKAFTNDYAAAEADDREILRISRLLPAKYDIRKSDVLSNLGNVLRINGKLDEAEAILRESVECSVEIQGDSYSSAQSRYYLARLYLEKSEWKNAEIEARKSVETLTQIKMQNYVMRLAETVLGLALTRLGKAAEGESHVRKALAGEQALQPKDARHVAVMQMALGECLFYQGKFADAESELLQAHLVLQTSFGPGNDYSRQAARDLVALYQGWKKPEQAAVFRVAASLQ